MKTVTTSRKQQKLIHVGDCLYRSNATDIYYGIFERDDRQVKRSLKTTDRELALRRVSELRVRVERLATGAGVSLHFAEYNMTCELIGGLAKRWIDIAGGTMEGSSRDRAIGVIKNLARVFGDVTARGLTLQTLERWAATRRETCSARTFNYELETLRRILDYAVQHGIILDNPARQIKRCKGHKKAIMIPSKEQFRKMLEVMRGNSGHDSADLAELLAYSGCRKGEVVGDAKYSKPALLWRDVDFALKVFTVTHSKNHEARTVPLFPAMEAFLCNLKARRPRSVEQDERIIPIDSGKKAIESACRKLGLSQYGHHTCRHFFCSNAIEAGIDFKVIAGWLGHKDGGVLVARTYGHLRNEHSAAMAKRMTFNATANELDNVVQLGKTA
jgi:site-specific recombinase XerD